ncbi:Os11g0286500 [Oryza sativa Japonica Group]|uniref:Os11g0286500 protein n=2 Tax=Oryza sativa subsp. japonica TaxID=39947 RepID=B7ELF8_ORYSJ|nr:hypothetical protein OsJ_33650 [Oryza sativa Japonica Group]KAB8114960.1 hypothetical protein EE612_054803 [Oryza sativa]KAF2910508.1 hypothetical protein DAI22_11g105200 [Oryza sativa Japonica Group]BAG93205.1 unnamed protein product [Oryza sativa Japonica Group]BAT13620.1 Os11g0286500 [Oryza sativa Japonica Group]
MSSGSTHRGEEKEKNIRYPCCTNVGSIWVGHAKEDKLSRIETHMARSIAHQG